MMEPKSPETTGSNDDRTALNRQLAQMLKGGVIMDVTSPEQAHIAEEAGACAVWRSSVYPPTFAPPVVSRA